MRNRLYLLLTLLIFTILFSGCQTVDDQFRFVFMTDIHVQPEQLAVEGFTSAIEKVNQLKPDFVITGGDLIMDALGQGEERSLMLYELYKNTQRNFTMPVYNTIGNHEVFGLYKESGISPDHPQYGKKMYIELLRDGQPPYYAFDHKGWHFIVLDAIGFTAERRYYGHIDRVQMDWLRQDLAGVAPATPIAISLHIPLISVMAQIQEGSNTPLSPGLAVVNSRQVLDAFKDRNLRLVLQGHLHIVEEIVFRNTHFITGGAVCGAWWSGAHEGFPEGYVVVDVKGGDFDWHYQTYSTNAGHISNNSAL
ncbi:metallophosphoesterase [candidate division KSB1 bacterium]|nr:metallophosphoesterase [candidate division KSB1 bacterium]